MNSDTTERPLARFLRGLPDAYNCRWDETAGRDLRRQLLKSLVLVDDDPVNWLLLFPHDKDSDYQFLRLSEAQGTPDGPEYSAAARGHACGHIFRPGESIYSCRTCALDDTCVLCVRCFNESDHEGHNISIGTSQSPGACCDCGDPEAWTRPVCCTIHKADADVFETAKSAGKAPSLTPLPDDVQSAVKETIALAIDYMCDVFSCSPEQQRQVKTARSVHADELHSRLTGSRYGWQRDFEDEPEWAMVLWNDEKHTVTDVCDTVARACRTTKSFGLQTANEVHERGRFIVRYDTDLSDLLRMASILEEIQLSVTVRSARDTFREEMCSEIVDWLNDIANCKVGRDGEILRNSISQALLDRWQPGTPLFKVDIGRAPTHDHEVEEQDFDRGTFTLRRSTLEQMPLVQLQRVLDRTAQTMEAMEPVDEQDAIAEDDGPGDDEDVVFTGLANVGGAQNRIVDLMRAAATTVTDTVGLIPTTTEAQAPETPDIDMDDDGPNRFADQIRPPSRPQVTHEHDSVGDTSSGLGTRSTLPGESLSDVAESSQPPTHWLAGRDIRKTNPDLSSDSLAKRLRIDCLIICEMRLWKNLRNELRDLFIRTLVVNAEHKSALALRLAALFTDLARLFLVADRESDHSIMNICVQLFTTPSITAEVLDRENLFSRLLSTLHAFTTARKVAYPEDVKLLPFRPIEQSITANKRFAHFYVNVRFMLQSDRVQTRIRDQPHYLPQFLDFVQLLQGIWPTTRAVDEHVQFEMDGAQSTHDMTAMVNHFCRLFAQSYTIKDDQHHAPLLEAVRQAGRYALANSLAQREFGTSHFTDCVTFRKYSPSETLCRHIDLPACRVLTHDMSFHHPLHNILAWLLVACKPLPVATVREYLGTDSLNTLLSVPGWLNTNIKPVLLDLSSDITLVGRCFSALFDVPLRVMVWSAQIRAKLWVRNGFSLRQQQSNYRTPWQRDFTVQRDFFLLQAGLVLQDEDPSSTGESLLFQMIERFDMLEWIHGRYTCPEGFERSQQLELAEELYLLLTALLCERDELLCETSFPSALQREIAHTLCFKPLNFSNIAARMPEKVLHQRETDFDDILRRMTNYKAPEGVSDHGTFELKDEYFDIVDPFYFYYSRNQREEAEQLLKRRIAKHNNIPVADAVFEPRLPPIRSGLFTGLANVFNTHLFFLVSTAVIRLAADKLADYQDLKIAHIEPLLGVSLHLLLVAINEDSTSSHHDHQPSICDRFFQLDEMGKLEPTLRMLQSLLARAEFVTAHARIRYILQRLGERRPEQAVLYGLRADPEIKVSDGTSTTINDKEARKQAALARQAKIMAQFKQQQSNFMTQQGLDWGDAEEDIDMTAVDSEDATETKLIPYPSEPCMLCQEETNEHALYGTLGWVEKSEVFQVNPPPQNGFSSFTQELLSTPTSLDRSAEEIRPQGHPILPVVTSPGAMSDGVGGRPDTMIRPITTSCGHMMHYSCFSSYIASIELRHGSQIARSHPEDVQRKEFLCPLCKAIGNIFLPIICKGRKEVSIGDLTTTMESYEAWLSRLSSDIKMSNSNAPTETLLAKSRARLAIRLHTQTYQDLLRPAVDDNEMLADSLDPVNGHQIGEALSRLPPFNVDPSNISNPVVPGEGQAGELADCYSRLHESIGLNLFGHRVQGLYPIKRHGEQLCLILASSIEALEIAQRGLSSTGSCLSGISIQNHTNLCILSDTLDTSDALRSMSGSTSSDQDMTLLEAMRDPVALSRDKDNFVRLVTWTWKHYEIWEAHPHHVLRLFTSMEVFGIITMLLRNLQSDDPTHHHGPQPQVTSSFARAFEALKVYLHQVMSDIKTADISPHAISLVRNLAQPYFLVWLRTCLIFMNIRAGVEFESDMANLDPALPEIDRLLSLLHLPDFDDLLLESLSVEAGNVLFQKDFVHGRRVLHGQGTFSTLRPTIFELVQLPKTYDALTEKVAKFECPTRHGPLREPTMCLLCGHVFCGQADCCRGRGGGAWHHVRVNHLEQGVFLNVNRKMIFFLHGTKFSGTRESVKGSFVAPAPYLDKYGETDMGSKSRGSRLFLNRKRYDKLVREAYLQHFIPSVISRKLDAESNPGGWDTL